MLCTTLTSPKTSAAATTSSTMLPTRPEPPCPAEDVSGVGTWSPTQSRMRWRIVVWSLNSSRSSTWRARSSICSGLRSSPCRIPAAAVPADASATTSTSAAATSAAAALGSVSRLRGTEVLGDAELEVEALGAHASIEVHERRGGRDEAHGDHRRSRGADHVAEHTATHGIHERADGAQGDRQHAVDEHHEEDDADQ